MSGCPLYITLPSRHVLTGLRDALRARAEWIAEPAERFAREYLDSFDGRLFQQGEMLEWQSPPEPGELLWYTPGRLSPPLHLSLATAPRFAWDLPPGPLQDALSPLLEMRALLPRARLAGRRQRLRQVDGQGKTLLRLELEQYRLLAPEGAPKRSGYALRLLPVRGYRRPLRELLAWLAEHHGVRPDGVTRLEALLAPAGPGDYSAKVRLALRPSDPAGVAVRALLLQLLEIMARNEAGTCADLDTEFLHDFRVAVRRTRTALGQLNSVFPLTPLVRFRRGFAWLGTITSPTRDLDVYLLGFEGYRDTLPPELREHLAPLHAFLAHHQRLEQQRLARTLAGARYRKLVEDWRSWLQRPVVSRRPPVDAGRPVMAVSGERTWRMFRRVLREGRAIGPESPATDLHELRKSCKKLRYLLEFFQSLYPPAAMKQLIRALKELQDHLGAFQDLEVQGHTLAHFAEQMQDEGAVPAATLEAMSYLVENLHSRQQFYRETFATHFEAFSARPNRQLFRALFRPDGEER